jgi:threonine-phosphate decarboxylase
MLQGHGDDAYQQEHPVRVNFSSNVRPASCMTPEERARTQRLQEHLRVALLEIDHYPEVAAETLTAQLAGRGGVSPRHLWVTNGAADALDRIALAWRGGHSWVPCPSFSEYEDAARRHDHTLEFGDMAALREDDFPRGTQVWWGNPHNPTGEVFSREEVLARVDARPDCLFVLDQAYAAFSLVDPVLARDAAERGNLVLVHSLTKEHAIPGLRLGYVVAGEKFIARLVEQAVPWAVNALALAAGEFLVNEPELPRIERQSWRAEALRLSTALSALPGVETHPSAMPFFLWRRSGDSAAIVKARLLRENGLLVRDAGNFRGLDAHWLRVAAQTHDENDQLVEAITSWTH